MSFTIRPFTEADYEPLAQLKTLVWQQTQTANDLRREDQRRAPHLRSGRLVAEVGGRFAGSAGYDQYAGVYHPRRFDLSMTVHPEFRRRGIGGALWERLCAAMAPLDPLSMTTGVSEQWPDSMRFLERRGFVEKMRNWESLLDLTAFDPDAFASAGARAKEQGYEIRSYAELADFPDRDRRIHHLGAVTRLDVPSVEPRTDVPFERWVQGLSDPTFMPDLYMIALKDGEMVGLSTIWNSHDPGKLHTGSTGVLRAHRGNGVAKALKVEGLRRAKAAGYRCVNTYNATTNAPMLAINDALGFVRQPAWIVYKLELKSE